MNSFFLCFLILLEYLKQLKGFSEEYYECLDSDKTISSHSGCTSIEIPENEGYKCCSTKVSYKAEVFYNCFPIKSIYTTSKDQLYEYISKSNLAFLFGDTGGELEIACPNGIVTTENYEKLSEEYLSCYDSHKKGVNNESDCTKNEIPTREGSKCCFLESSQINNNGTIIDDKRCYIIQDEYFTKKNFNNYLLDESNIQSLDQIINTNITIKCKNLDTFSFPVSSKSTSNIEIDDDQEKPSKSTSNIEIDDDQTKPSKSFSSIEIDDEKKTEPESQKGKSKVKTWEIVLIIVVGLIFLVGIGLLIFWLYRKKSIGQNEEKASEEIKSSEKKEEGKNSEEISQKAPEENEQTKTPEEKPTNRI